MIKKEIKINLRKHKEKTLERDIIEHLKKSEDDIENGRTISAEKVFRELREKYGY